MKVGVITYDCPHLKTEQLVCRYSRDARIEEITLFALPFKSRKKREVLIKHRPDMQQSILTESLEKLPKVKFKKWDGRGYIGSYCDLFVIGGAGILDVSFAGTKPIINAHPGIIPLTRGLDSFKWAIYNNDPIGNTLHLIDQQVDKGEILAIIPTPIFRSDSLETLARRHYEYEIEMLANVLDFIDKRVMPTEKEKPATMRMNYELEAEVVSNFECWKKLVIG